MLRGWPAARDHASTAGSRPMSIGWPDSPSCPGRCRISFMLVPIRADGRRPRPGVLGCGSGRGRRGQPRPPDPCPGVIPGGRSGLRSGGRPARRPARVHGGIAFGRSAGGESLGASTGWSHRSRWLVLSESGAGHAQMDHPAPTSVDRLWAAVLESATGANSRRDTGALD